MSFICANHNTECVFCQSVYKKFWTICGLFITDIRMQYYTFYDSPVGRLMIASDGAAINGLWIQNQKYYARGANADMAFDDGRPILSLARRWLDDYFAGHNPDITTIPIAPHGTDFQQRVWRELCRIPYGQTRTYNDIARIIGTSPRAVGGAVGRNPISIIIPCHRVIGTGGNLVGYAGGIDVKNKLLQMERADN